VSACLYRIAIELGNEYAANNLQNMTLAEEQKAIVNALVCSNHESVPRWDQAAALEWLCAEYPDALGFVMMQRPLTQSIVQLINDLLPFPIAEEVLPHLIV
jgi:hypothetical protein